MDNTALNFEFKLRTNTVCGEKKALNLAEYLIELGYSKPGIIIDINIINVPYVQEILSNVKKNAALSPIVWEYNFRSEPEYDALDSIRENYLDSDRKPIVDCFVGIGGGSVIDFAKGLATVTVNLEKSITYRGFPKNLKMSLPTIALPTTAGTGSEVTYNAVFINKEDMKKLGINTHNNYPVLAILDPILTQSCPKSVTAASGMDALVHCTESYVAKSSTPLTKMFAKEAFKYLYNNLSKILDDPNDLVIRSNIQYGAYLAGLSLLGSGGGPTGALSYPLGVHFKVPHGFAGAVFLPSVIEHNVTHGYDYSELYDLIEGADPSLLSANKNRIFAEKIHLLSKKLDIPSLRSFGVSDDNVGLILNELPGFTGAFSQNPVPFSVDDAKKMVLDLLK